MRNQFPQEYWGISDESKHEMVLNGRTYARQQGLEGNESHARFITLMWLIGPNFFLCPGYSEALSATTMSENERLDCCFEMNKERAVNAICKADALYWYPEMVERRAELRA